MNVPPPRDNAPEPDSEPHVAPSLPDANLWADSEGLAPLPPAPTPSPAANDPLETIGHIGRYALKYRIGEGGLGTVYAAHDPLLTRLIAIKTLNLEIGAEERQSFNALFLQEARAAASLSHPNIVTVFDAGVSDDSAYIAMELLKGRDLRQLLKDGWRPTPAQAALIARRVADALAYAHTKGIVHCDVKPANIFMVGRTQPRVLDFGIARIAHRHDGDSGSHIAAGSPYYMAPEQIRGETVDRRADVFSLGVVLYELLTGNRPFRGHSLEQITNAVLDHEPPLASEANAEVPEALAQIAARAMAKDPEQRFRSARSLSRELRHWLDEQAGAAGAAPRARTLAPSRRRLLAAVAASLVAVVGVGLWLSGDATAPAPAVAVSAPPVPRPVTPAPLPAPIDVTPAAGPTGAASAALQVAAAEPAPAEKPAAPAARPAPKPAAKTTTTPPKAARDTRPARPAPAVVATGTVRIAVSPWGQLEVNGAAAGTTPPVNELNLPEGRHQITIRNADFPPHSVTVDVVANQPVTLRHRFGS